MAFCLSCGEPVIFANEELVYPFSSGLLPHEDMPEVCSKIFIEAQSILNLSPRSSCSLLRLCLEQLLSSLGFAQSRLIDQIHKAAPDGSDIKKYLEACRLAGNTFVHSGDLKDLTQESSKHIALSLSIFINRVVEIFISMPKEAEQICGQFKSR